MEKAVEAAMATLISSGSGGLTPPMIFATSKATGAIRTAVAVLEVNWLNTDVSRKNEISIK